MKILPSGLREEPWRAGLSCAATSGTPLRQVAADQAVGLRTLERWHAVFKEGGIGALAGPEPRPRPRKIPSELVALIRGLALVKPPLSTAVIARKANRAAADRGWSAVSYSTVRTLTRGLEVRVLPA